MLVVVFRRRLREGTTSEEFHLRAFSEAVFDTECLTGAESTEAIRAVLNGVSAP